MTGRGRSIRRGVRDERGSATTLSLAFVVVLVTAGLVATTVAAVLADRHRAQAAADLAAVAAAAASAGTGVVEASGAPCLRAEAIAAANGTALVACAVHGSRWRVEVRTPPRQLAWLRVSVPAVATAAVTPAVTAAVTPAVTAAVTPAVTPLVTPA